MITNRQKMEELKMNLTMNHLENNFEMAIQTGAKYVAVLVEMEGFPESEVIINERANFETKLAYYQKTYDGNLQHKYAKGIAIVGFTYGDSFQDISDDFNQ